MIVKWFGQGTIEPKQLRDLGISHAGMAVGLVGTGETIEDEDDGGNPITREIRKPGVAINFSGTPTDEVLEQIDLLLPLCKREGKTDFPHNVARNLDLRENNPQKEAYKLSALYGLTHEQLDTYIDTNVTDFASAKEFVRKLAHVELWLVKQNRLDE